MRKHSMVWKAAAVLAATVILAACGGSPPVRSITLTFIRHAQSEANAAGIIDTSVPGPGLSPEGKAQAEQLAHQLARNKYDAVYASTMVRTQQTAAPLAAELGKQVEVLQGLQELSTGWFDGKPEAVAAVTYLLSLRDWLDSDMLDSVPGSNDGKEFNDRFTGAIQKIYGSGHNRPVVFSHLYAIEYWTLLNARNGKRSLALTHPLPNVGRVEITGNPVTGWTLVDWDGIRDFGG